MTSLTYLACSSTSLTSLSEQARDIATDALVKGKKVVLDYELTGVSITVSERDGSKHVSRLKWWAGPTPVRRPSAARCPPPMEAWSGEEGW